MRQQDLVFARPDIQPPPIKPRDPNVARQDTRRLTGQNAAVLARLRAGPATAAELAAISLKYTSRISDLRAAGAEVVFRRFDAMYVLTRDVPG